jgi:PAS domain S-box-containing protein
LLGRSRTDLLGAPLADVFHPLNPQSDERERSQLLAGEIPAYSSQMSTTRNDGQRISVNAVFTVVHDESIASEDCYLVVIEDVSPLKRARKALHSSEQAREQVARRLIHAQEAERTRIARELHDDIGQSLAVLKIQISRAGQSASGKRQTSNPRLVELTRSVEAVAEKVGRLSHQLHSSELEFLGLSVAIKSHCREVAEQYGISVKCVCTDVPVQLDGAVSLALLRVAQEALHNVTKHAHATSVRVELAATANELELTIMDNGVGFEADASPLSASLGLISMRERMHLVGGELSVTSAVGTGTSVRARVLIDSKPSTEPS